MPAKPQPCLDAWHLALLLLLIPCPETTEATKRRSCCSRQGLGGDPEETCRPAATRPASRPECRAARRAFQLRSPPAGCCRGCEPSRHSQQSAGSGEMGSSRHFQLLSVGVVCCVKKGALQGNLMFGLFCVWESPLTLNWETGLWMTTV